MIRPDQAGVIATGHSDPPGCSAAIVTMILHNGCHLNKFTENEVANYNRPQFLVPFIYSVKILKK